LPHSARRCNLTSMRIEAARPEDCRAIAEVNVSAWQQAYRHILPADFLASRAVEPTEVFWRDQLANASLELLLARRDTAVLGFVALGPSRDADAADCGEIWSIYVAPEVWSQGAGRRLCLTALERLRARAYATATLWVLAENQRALRFYRSLGFAVEADSARDFELGGARVGELRCRLALA